MHRCFQQTHKINLHGAGSFRPLEEAVVQHQVRNTLFQELQGSCGAACPLSTASPIKCAYRNRVYTRTNRKTSKSKCCDWQIRCSIPLFFFSFFLLPLRNTQSLNSRLQGAGGWELAQTLLHGTGCVLKWFRLQVFLSHRWCEAGVEEKISSHLSWFMMYCKFYINLTKLFSSLLAVPLKTALPLICSALNYKNAIFKDSNPHLTPHLYWAWR